MRFFLDLVLCRPSLSTAAGLAVIFSGSLGLVVMCQGHAVHEDWWWGNILTAIILLPGMWLFISLLGNGPSIPYWAGLSLIIGLSFGIWFLLLRFGVLPVLRSLLRRVGKAGGVIRR
ncbi:hypothetical protein BH09VER1_BH09VER1_43720 [soil metagenome]